ncbi:MAG: DUF11 domain-containing protein [Flavobacteriales bacterium]|nr:DUF11 domain-containing protein [Flavobacteriales bacterium]
MEYQQHRCLSTSLGQRDLPGTAGHQSIGHRALQHSERRGRRSRRGPLEQFAHASSNGDGGLRPNDKLATTSTRASDARYFIGQDEWIDYTIRFQNTGTDTAFFVVITDTLPSNLDPSTFHPGSSSHTHTVSISGQYS